MPLDIVRNDLRRMAVDAIVNSANPLPVVGEGVDSALHGAAGPSLLAERRAIGRIGVGEAAVTGAGSLPARYVVHTVGPVWRGGNAGEAEDVARCYRSCLDAAVRLGCASIAFPLISTGAYGFPKELALRAATDEIARFLREADDDLSVYLVVYDDESFRISQRLFDDVASFIDDRLESAAPELREAPMRSRGAGAPMREAPLGSAPLDAGTILRAGAPRLDDEELAADSRRCDAAAPSADDGLCAAAASRLGGRPHVLAASQPAVSPVAPDQAHDAAAPAAPDQAHDAAAPVAPARRRRFPFSRRLKDAVDDVEEGFSEALLRLIDARGLADPQVYKRANIDRKLFSKIRSNGGYRPSKATALALAVALELDLDETRDLIARAGYALTHASRADIIVE